MLDMALIQIVLLLFWTVCPSDSVNSVMHELSVQEGGWFESMFHHRSDESVSFPLLTSTVAPDPTQFWGEGIRKAPYPTNSGWLNFVLNNGTAPEYIHPYTFQLSQGILSFCYPTRFVQPSYIYQVFVASISVSYLEGGPVSRHTVTHYDDLTVTLQLGSRVSVPLVRGSPYVTFLFDKATPVFSTIHAVLEIDSNVDSTKHKVLFNNSQTWFIYCSSPLHLGKDLKAAEPFSGVVRFAVLPTRPEAESILDCYRTSFAVGGDADFSVPFRVKYKWTTSGWGELLLLTLPYHRNILATDARRIPELYYSSMDGTLQGIVGKKWVLDVTPIAIGWYSKKGVPDEDDKEQIHVALAADIANLTGIQVNSTYFYGKALARVARLGLIAEELVYPHLVAEVRKYLRSYLTPWLDGVFPGNAFVYDGKWGGIVSRDGASNVGADFGLAVYNDHHYHFGYFVYAGAVLAKLDMRWGHKYKSHLYALARDYVTTDRSDNHFTRLRNFDPWMLHSWAGGLTEFNDGRNQESTSEAINSYYAAALLGLAYCDSTLVNLGLTLAAFEILVAKALWHIPESANSIYEPEFVKENRVVGVLWSNKRDTSLWFASAEAREDRLGIQLLPITPISELVFNDKEYTQELVNWTLQVLDRPDVTDSWRGFVYALQAVSQPTVALRNIRRLTSYDDGNSLTNLLWWVYTR